MKKSVSLLFLLIINVFSFSQNNIDQDLEKCLSQRNSTAGQISCVISAQNSWDKELNKNLHFFKPKTYENRKKGIG